MDLLPEVLRASHRIRPHVLRTPLIPSPYLSEQVGGDIYLKLESEQYTGSFKARGSANKLLYLKETQPGVAAITASTGNHGLGFARALDLFGMKGKIVLPEKAASSKVEALKRFDVELEFHGRDSYEAEMYAKQQAEDREMTWVSPYNDPQVIGGQGTIGVELCDQLPGMDAVLATIGGGGLISGIATYLKAVNDEIEVIGCQPDRSPEMTLSVRAGEYRSVDPQETLSDGSAGGFEPDAITFEVCKTMVDDFVLVSEDEIAQGIRTMLSAHSKVVEGAAGVAVASCLKHREALRGKTTALVICGANISVDQLKKLL